MNQEHEDEFENSIRPHTLPARRPGSAWKDGLGIAVILIVVCLVIWALILGFWQEWLILLKVLQ